MTSVEVLLNKAQGSKLLRKLLDVQELKKTAFIAKVLHFKRERVHTVGLGGGEVNLP